MIRFWGSVLTVLLLTLPAAAAGKLAVKVGDGPPPKEVSEPIRALLTERVYQVQDAAGQLVAEFWFRKELPAKATAEQIKNGLTYKEIEESTVIGAVRFAQLFTDYRKQKIKPGVYTLRMGLQPQDGDHMGTAPYPDFCLLLPAALDAKADLLETKDMRELSVKSTPGSHPAVMLLFPNDKPTAMPEVQNKGMDTWTLSFKQDVLADKQKASLGIALTVAGHTSAE